MKIRVGAYVFRPGLWASLCTAAALAVLIALGFWQLERLAWKEGVLADIKAGLSARPLLLDGTDTDAKGLNYNRVRAEGEYDHSGEIFLSNRVYDGQVGRNLLTPLLRENAPPIWVNRGWVPMEDTADVTRPTGQQQVTGIAVIPALQGRFVPDNDPDSGFWIWTDLQAMSTHAGIQDAVPFLLYATEGQVGSYPIGGQARLDFPNDHLQYALTWFIFAFILLCVYIIYHTHKEV